MKVVKLILGTLERGMRALTSSWLRPTMRSAIKESVPLKCDEQAEVMMQTGSRVRLSVAILAVGLFAQWCSAQAASPIDLQALRDKYDQCLTGIQTNTNKTMQDWPQSYIAELKKVEQKLQGSGDLDGMLAVRKERERFEKEKKIPESALSDSAVLKDLQLKWRKTPEAMEIDKSKRIVALARSYMAALDEAKKQLTKQGKVEQAIEAKNEIERVKTSAPVTAAEFALANAAASAPPDADKRAKPVAAKSPDAGGAEKPAALPATLRASLVLYYSFDNDEDGKVMDKSGNGNDGNWVGDSMYEAGVKGQAARFRSKNTYVVSATEPLNMNGWKEATVSLWVCLAGYTTYGHVINRGPLTTEQAGTFELALGPTYGSGVIAFRSGPAKVAAEKPPGGTSLALNRWYHLTMTYDRAGLRYYIDAKLEKDVRANERNTPLWDGADTKLVIGNMSRLPFINWMDMFFNGLVDEVYIFNRALSGSDVKLLYQTQKPPKQSK